MSMDKQTKKRIFNWVKIVIIIYCVIGILLYSFQNHLLFHPEKLNPDHKFDFPGPFQELSIPVNNTDTISLVKFFPEDSSRNGVVLYFHGNRNNIEYYAGLVHTFTNTG